jgi:hypothetical protein
MAVSSTTSSIDADLRRPPMGDPDVDALVRERRQIQHVRRDARCARCKENRHLSRTPDDRLLCYACRRLETGGSAIERDHVAGRANLGGLLVDLLANDHRTVTDIRTRLGASEWPKADGDPLLVLAHVLLGIASLLVLFAEWLTKLSGDLVRTVGVAWWIGTTPHPVVS